MKKKLFIIFLSAVVAVTLILPFSASAAGAMEATAKAGDATVDGVISEGEYGNAFVLNGDTGKVWAGLAKISSPITYNFAWSDKGLYIALSYAESVAATSQFQINCNPGGQLGGDDQGLFITFQPNGTVLMHNHNTPLGNVDATTLSVDVTSKITVVSKVSGGIKVSEALIPMEAFRIKDANFTFSAGEMACSAFAVLMKADGTPGEVGAAVSSDLADWTMKALGLGKLTLAAPAGGETPTQTPSTADPTTAPTKAPDKNPTTSDTNWIVPAICIVTLAATVAAIIYGKSKRAYK